MNYYIQIDPVNRNKAINLYTEETYNGLVLPDSISVTRNAYVELIPKFHQGYVIWYSETDGTFLSDHPVFDDTNAAKVYMLNIINTMADEVLHIFLATYPRAETISWDIQEREARLYVENPTEETQSSMKMLPALAEVRGIDLLDLCHKVIAKADFFAIYSGKVFGKRQLFEDRLALCSTAGDVLDLEISYQDIIDEIHEAIANLTQQPEVLPS